MQYMGLNDIREKFLSFFESKGHLRLPSFPLVPQNDKSILLINAGMTPLKPYFTGQQEPPCKRVTTCQKCIRTPDIERVGKTQRHATFFEMLGNFSFGDYFKHEIIPWAWEFVTQVMQIPVEKLYVTVYQDDDEAYDIWTKKIGVDPSHVSRMGKEDNFWEHGAGPCGPCSEIYYDRGPEHGCGRPDCHVGCECDRYVEFWNLVFTQFDNDGNGNYTKLQKCNIDTGMGLERLACIMQDVDSLFDVDTIKNIIVKLSVLSDKKYGQNHDADVSLRVVTDHIRSTTFMVCDGILPSNEGRGYVLRRLLRRAARHGRLLGIKSDTFLSQLADVVIQESKVAYPELEEKRDYIKRVIQQEEERFNQTIDQGLQILSQLIETAKKDGKSILDGASVFKLYDTFGFPIDLTKEIAAESGLQVDEDSFVVLMEEQKTRARDAAKGFADSAWKGAEALEGISATSFIGYDSLICADAKVLAVIKNEQAVHTAVQGDAITIVLQTTPFYAESGGQVGDQGLITGDQGSVIIKDCKKSNDIYLHIGFVADGRISVGDIVHANVNRSTRQATMKNHSAAHLLQAALREVLGDHVSQAGSYVDACRMRFDFTHFEAVKPEELEQVEELVNAYILTMADVTVQQMAIEEARKEGAIALFSEKYGDVVRVVKMGDISTEFCAGTHVQNTAQIGLFKIISETSVSAGVRRIEAVTGLKVLEYLKEKENVLVQVAETLKTNEKEIAVKAASLVNEIKALQKEIESLNAKLASSALDGILKTGEEINGKFVITAKVDAKADVLRSMCDTLRGKYTNIVALLASVDGEKVSFAIGVGIDAVKNGAHGGNLIKIAAQKCGGGGGGRPDSATAGGKDCSKLQEAFAAVKEALR